MVQLPAFRRQLADFCSHFFQVSPQSRSGPPAAGHTADNSNKARIRSRLFMQFSARQQGSSPALPRKRRSHFPPGYPAGCNGQAQDVTARRDNVQPVSGLGAAFRLRAERRGFLSADPARERHFAPAQGAPFFQGCMPGGSGCISIEHIQPHLDECRHDFMRIAARNAA